MLSRLLGDLCARYTAPATQRRSRRRRIDPPVAALVELLESRELLSATPVVVDNSQAAFSNVRDWQDLAGGYNGTLSIANPDEAGALAAWDFTGLENGQYYLQATWTAGADRATNALFTARSEFGASGRDFTVNQSIEPSSVVVGGVTRYKNLGVVTVHNGALRVELTNVGADGKVIADAVRLQPVASTDNSVPVRTERLQEISRALFAYHEVYGQLPPSPLPALINANGRYLSWRVHLLPFLGYGELYQQFHLDEAWDSPNNLPLLNQMPDVFRSREIPAGAGVTGFQRADVPGGFHITGAGGPTLFGSAGGTPQMVDNPLISLLVAETGHTKAVPWTAPDDTPYSLGTEVTLFLGPRPFDGWLAAMGDGLVHVLDRDISQGSFQSVVDWNNGDVIGSLTLASIFDDPYPSADAASQQKLKSIMLAMFNYHDTYNSLPPGLWNSSSQNYDANGQPFLSWRVHLLPFLGEMELYNQFHLDEPWNSQHNMTLLSWMPEAFLTVGNGNKTAFQVFKGPGAWPSAGSQTDPDLYGVVDGLQDTIAVVQVPESYARFWTQPDGDVPFDPANPLAGLGPIPALGLWAAMFDGSVRRISPDITANNLKAAVTWFGSEIQGPDELANAYLDYPRPETIAARREKLRQIGIAMHYYHQRYDSFPISGSPDQFDANGQPLLSWRVHLLPYLGYLNLYQQFHLNEPWNSPHNVALLDEMPDIFRTRDLPVGTNRTGFQLLTGPEAYRYTFSGPAGGRGPRINDYRDGLSNTLLMVETQGSQAVEWTRPDGDLTFDPANPLASLDWTGIENAAADGILVALGDGTVRAMRPTISAANLSSLATLNGSEVLSAVAESESFFDQRPYSEFGSRGVAGQPVYEQFRRSQTALKQLMLGMHNYEDVFNEFPVSRGDSRQFDANGNPLLSWRVHILPWIDQGALYAQFHLDEPWDSPHNLPLLDQMPEIFRSRGLPVGTNLTGYQVVAGPTAYDTRISVTRSISRVTDGTSSTLGIIETPPELAVAWTKPDDLPFDPADPFAAIRALVSDYIVASRLDGSVHAIHPWIDPADAAALITWAGGDTSRYPDHYVDEAVSLTPEIRITDSTGALFENEFDIVSFGKAPADTPVVKTLTVKNTGSQTLSISSIVMPPGYTLMSSLTPIAPGATAPLTIRLDATNAGVQNWFISIYANIPNQPVTRVGVYGVSGANVPNLVVSAPGGVYDLGAAFNASAMVTGVGGAFVNGDTRFRYYAGAAATGSFTNLPPTNAGTYTVVGDFISGDPLYFDATSAPVTFTIAPRPPTFYVWAPDTTYNGEAPPLSAVVDAPLWGSVELRFYSGGTPTEPYTTAVPSNAGTYTLVALFTSTDSNHASTASTPETFTIFQAVPEIRVHAPGGLYNGNPHPATATASGSEPTVPGVMSFRYYTGTAASGPFTTTAPRDVGAYTVVALFTPTDPNYTSATSSPVTFSIIRPPLGIELSSTWITENLPVGSIVGQFTPGYAPTPPTFRYTLSGSDLDNAKFTIDSNGNLRTAVPVDYETNANFTIRVRVTDELGQYAEEFWSLSVRDVVEVNPYYLIIDENKPKGTVAATLSMPNPVPGHTYAYALVKGRGDVSNASFAISGSTLFTKAVFDYEAGLGYSVRIRATDVQTKAFVDQIVNISVANVLETPTGFTLSRSSVQANRPIGTYVGGFYTTPDDAGSRPTFTLVPGSGATDNSLFTIDADGSLKTAAVFVYNKKSKGYSIRVRCVAQTGQVFELIFRITVTK